MDLYEMFEQQFKKETILKLLDENKDWQDGSYRGGDVVEVILHDKLEIRQKMQ